MVFKSDHIVGSFTHSLLHVLSNGLQMSFRLFLRLLSLFKKEQLLKGIPNWQNFLHIFAARDELLKILAFYG